MYLKRVELAGFKSFADRTELEFVPGITAVVGPNGSGKSNISDAIRWVLGEQSAKTLRGGKMEDIIFSGSMTRKAVNFCEISITLDNSSQTLPLDFHEVTITRRVYRSGDSEYLINKQACRLKDITELFMDTGIGKEAYSIIGQGRIEEILSTKSEDRRGIFEEASGIVKYKTRKREAEKKLQDTEQNLLRIHDLVSELEVQIEPLAQQSEKAIQYKAIKEKLKHNEIAYYIYQIDHMYASWTTANEQLEGLKTQQIERSTIIQTHEAQVERNRWEMQLIDEELQNLNEQLLKLSEDFEKCEGQGEVLRERKKNYENNRQQLVQTLLVQEKRYQDKQNEITQVTEQLEQVRNQLTIWQARLRDEERVLLGVNHEAYMLAEEQLKLQLLDILNRMAQARNDIRFAEQQMQGLHRRLERYDEEKQQIQEQWQQLKSNKEMLDHKLSLTVTEIDTIRNQYLQLVQHYERTQTNQQDIQSSIRKIEQQMGSFTSRRDTIKEMMEDFDGFVQGVKEVLKANHNQTLKGIHGAVAELISVPAHLELAIETSLGAALQNVIIDTEASARVAIAYLKQRQLGRATFLPMDVMKGRMVTEQELRTLNSASGFVGIAKDLITYTSNYRDVFAHLLGQVIIAKTLEEANHLAAKVQFRYRVVTLDGDVVNPGGAMTGGSIQRKGSGLLSRQRQLTELDEAIHTSNQELTTCLATQQTNQQEIKRMATELEQLRQSGEAKRIEEQQIRTQLESLEIQEHKAQQLLGTHTQDRIVVDAEEEEVLAKKHESELSLEQCLQEEDIMQQAIREAEQTRKLSETEKEEIQSQLTEIKVQVAAITQEKLSLNDQQTRLHQDADQMVEELDIHREALQKIDEDMSHQDSESMQQIELLNDLKIRKQQCVERTDFKKAERTLSMQKNVTEENETRTYRSELKKIEEQIHKIDVNFTRLDVELETLLKKLSEEYELSYELAKVRYPVPADIHSTQQLVKELKKEIHGLGDVNLGAIDEYTRVSERYNFLFHQQNDLVDAKTALYQVIHEMDIEMSKKFKATFEEIRSHFDHVFSKLFGGGHADLILSDPENLLDTGVEIIAQPPGKKLQNLQLLSGGERALTAIALLFSILHVKPVPFCVLDEVEAALDETNVSRFANYLKEFSAKTQFIVVTHRKGTMEEANVLYGVTMEDDGVSKLVAVKLENYLEVL